MISINERALELAKEMIANAEALGVAVTHVEGGATVVDAGIDVPGSLEAGRLFAEICLGCLGTVSFCQLEMGPYWLPGVTVTVSDPVVACMASQYAGWAIKGEGFFAMGSGPARALYAGEALFDEIAYRDQARVAVLALETKKQVPAAVAAKVARKCGVRAQDLYLLIAPTASIVGSVQVAARVVETGLHKMHEIGFDIGAVVSGMGTCPLAPIAANDLQAIGRTNDGVLYGGRAWYTVQATDSQIEAIIDRLPSSASRDYGTPFSELLRRYDGDFYRIDPLLFSPAQVGLNNVTTGRTFTAGRLDSKMIALALLGVGRQG
jgi:methenyltetrahydromethanopterin cyclohydrolase